MPLSGPALLVIDVQSGFDDPRWGARNNPQAEANIARLIGTWRGKHLPLILVRHDSPEPDSPLHPAHRGNALRGFVDGPADLLVTKQVNSAFHGEPDLDHWLRQHRLDTLVICGVTTSHCCETTARIAGNLGYDVRFVIDATHTFDRRDIDGLLIPAAEIARVTAANLEDEFAQVTTTDAVLASLEED
jgi:nicotinamidase-related amidase